MSDWQTVWLAIMAVALAVMATIQIAVIIVAARFAKQALDAVQDVRREVRPLIEKVNRIADDAARATALAVVQVERVDRVLEMATERIEETIGIVQDAVIAPIRQGTAILAALKAGFAMFRKRGDGPRPRRDDDEALFVG